MRARTGFVRRFKPWCLVSVAICITAASAICFAAAPPRIPVMLVGVTHLVSKNDLNNSPDINALDPERQMQIADLTQRLKSFKATKVMIEAPFGDERFQSRYEQYLKGTWTLGANEIYQYGFRLAALSGNKTIYPIDTTGDFPFDYDRVKATAGKYGQSQILRAADAATAESIKREHDLIRQGTILDILRFVNEPETISHDAAWYLYVDRVGGGQDYAGADLVSYWYARNLHIFANIMRNVAPNDRIVVIIGAGHLGVLRQLVDQSSDLELVDPEPYLR